MSNQDVPITTVLKAMHRAMVVRPAETIARSLFILKGKASPADMRGSPATVVTLAVLWIGTSSLFDLHGGTRPLLPYFGAFFEVFAWTFLLRWITSMAGHAERYWKTWMAVAGVSIIVWLIGVALFTVGASREVAFITTYLVAVRGIGVTLKDATGDLMQYPYGTTGLTLFLIGFFSFSLNLSIVKLFLV